MSMLWGVAGGVGIDPEHDEDMGDVVDGGVSESLDEPLDVLRFWNAYGWQGEGWIGESMPHVA